MTETSKISSNGDQDRKSGILLKNGKIVNADGVQNANMFIEDGIIKKINPDMSTIPQGTAIIDCTGKYILPGGIDASCHFNGKSNGILSCDDFLIGSESALKGGTTTIINSLELDDDSASLTSSYLAYKERARRFFCCDFSIHLTLRRFNDNIANEIKVLINEFGVTSFRLNFTDEKSCNLTDVQLFDLFELCRKYGALIIVQIGNAALHNKLSDVIWTNGIKGPEGHFYCRDVELSESCISRMTTLSRLTNCPLLISGCNTVQSLQFIAQQQSGIIWTELNTAALHFDSTQLNKAPDWNSTAQFVSFANISIDSESKRNLQRYLVNGTIDITGSSHMRFNESQKQIGQNDFRKIPLGSSGVKERMKILWKYGVNSGTIDVCKFVALTSTNTAHLFNLYPRKGAIKEGSDADLVVWDPESKDFNEEDYDSLFGEIDMGHPDKVIAGGELIVDQKRFNANAGRGRFLQLEPHNPFIYRKIYQKEEIFKSSLKSIKYKPTKTVDESSNNKVSAESAPGGINSTDSRSSSRRPMNKCLSGTGAKNLQESTFSFGGSQIDDTKTNRPSIRTHQPPGGKSSYLW